MIAEPTAPRPSQVLRAAIEQRKPPAESCPADNADQDVQAVAVPHKEDIDAEAHRKTDKHDPHATLRRRCLEVEEHLPPLDQQLNGSALFADLLLLLLLFVFQFREDVVDARFLRALRARDRAGREVPLSFAASAAPPPAD